MLTSWNKRWFCVDPTTRELLYFTSKTSKSPAGARHGLLRCGRGTTPTLRLPPASLPLLTGGINMDDITKVAFFDDKSFQIEARSRNFMLRAMDAAQAEEWVEKLSVFVSKLQEYRDQLDRAISAPTSSNAAVTPGGRTPGTMPAKPKVAAASAAPPAAPTTPAAQRSSGAESSGSGSIVPRGGAPSDRKRYHAAEGDRDSEESEAEDGVDERGASTARVTRGDSTLPLRPTSPDSASSLPRVAGRQASGRPSRMRDTTYASDDDDGAAGTDGAEEIDCISLSSPAHPSAGAGAPEPRSARPLAPPTSAAPARSAVPQPVAQPEPAPEPAPEPRAQAARRASHVSDDDSDDEDLLERMLQEHAARPPVQRPALEELAPAPAPEPAPHAVSPPPSERRGQGNSGRGGSHRAHAAEGSDSEGEGEDKDALMELLSQASSRSASPAPAAAAPRAGAARAGVGRTEGKAAEGKATEGKSSERRERAAGVAADSNWLDEDWDEEDGEHDEEAAPAAAERPAAHSRSPQPGACKTVEQVSAVAGVQADENWLESDWDEDAE